MNNSINLPFTNIILQRESYPIQNFIEIESLIWFICIVIQQCFAHNPMLTDDYVNEYEDVKKSTKTYEDTDKRFTKEKIEKLPFISEEDEAWHQEHKAIAINGYWYDITNFIEFHPGGNVITRFL